jgi:hypothetical protein
VESDVTDQHAIGQYDDGHFRPGQSAFRGACLEAVAILAGATGLLMFPISLFREDLPGAVPLAILFIAGLAHRRARRHFIRSYKDVLNSLELRQDRRPPILYLRPFSQDGSFHSAPFSLFSNRGALRRLEAMLHLKFGYEELLQYAFRHAGLLIAIGPPGETLPQLGALREYPEQPSAWRERVRLISAVAQLVIMQIGTSDGFLDELRFILRNVPAAKVLLVFPRLTRIPGLELYFGQSRRRSAYRDFLDLTRELFPHQLPEKLGRWHFMRFTRDWRPEPVLTRTKQESPAQYICADYPRGEIEWVSSIMEESTFPSIIRGLLWAVAVLVVVLFIIVFIGSLLQIGP